MTKINVYSTLCLMSILVNFTPHSTDAATPTIFILGDSTADVGTNTQLPDSRARADFPHNGVDFPNSRPTGRFSNGFNSADYLAKLMGLKRSPAPFLFLLTLKSKFHKHLDKGVNFASGGAGLLDMTGLELRAVPLSEQINQFATVRNNLTAFHGRESTKAMLSKSLFFISIGSNDIFGYFMSNNSLTKEKFMDLLMTSYEKHILDLYMLGARKFGIISVPPVGCCPAWRLVNGTGACFGAINDFSLTFLEELEKLLKKMSSELKGMKYSLGNAYLMTTNVLKNAHVFGFENVDAACCGSGALNAETPCNATATLCPDRRKYLFWDMFHPTQAASRLAAETLYNGPPLFVSPINFFQLAKDC